MSMKKERADLGFGDALDSFDPAEWSPEKISKTRAERQNPKEFAKIAEKSGFKSREAGIISLARNVRADREKSLPRRRRTGRNAQFNLKARPDVVKAYCDLADSKGWGLGETLELAVTLLQREYGR